MGWLVGVYLLAMVGWFCGWWLLAGYIIWWVIIWVGGFVMASYAVG